MKSTVSKYLIGFVIFMVYYLVARNVENKIASVRQLTNIGTPAA